MAEGVLFNIVAGFAANVASEPFKKIRLSLGVKDELRKLNNTLTVIQAVLLDAEEKQTRDNRVKVWLDRLEEVVYDADNLVDEFHYQHLRRKVLFGKKKARKVRIFFSRSSNQLFFRYKMAKKLKKIRQTLDEIKADQVFLHILKPDSKETRGPSKLSERETHSFVTDEDVIGRDDDKNEIKKLLLDNHIENNDNVSIVSLVGIGGLGKTTLAKFVFNNEEIKKHFDKQTYWVCVSDVFDLKSLVQKIVRSVTGTSPDQNLDLEQLQKQLREKIEGKKYLLVLDDVWNENINKWDELIIFLKEGAKGSKVLITTRSKTVAQIVHSETYMLRGLDEHKSWDLFERVVFWERNYERTAQYHRLVKIGKDIVKKCGGVPLAIKTIGRLLSTKQPTQNLESQWKSFRDTKLAEINYENQTDILPTLKLSYDNLPSHLKHCFAFCSLFPKDYKIDVQQLIKLWMAQGFIEHDGSSRQLEVIGYDNFIILFSGCFFQEAEQDELLETVKSCKMHDLMHDLASLVAGKSIKIFDENIAENFFEKVRHVFGLKYDCLGQNKTQLLEQKKMRTFILHEFESLTSSDCNEILSNLKLLRALSFRIDTETLPNSLGKLKHLRYLNLSSYKLKELPNSITELYNLHTLILSNCECLVSLPVDIKNLINLRHLEIFGCRELTRMPRGIGELTLLETLDMFVVAANQSSESAGFGELGKLNNLRGRLVIQIKGLGESRAAQCLKNKEHLESLVLNWEDMKAKEALECLEPPHQDMKALEVNSYPGETFPPNWLSSLTDLVQLRLAGFKECKYLPPLHHLSSLQNLELYDLSALEFVSNRDREWDPGYHLSTSSTSFLPSLKSLKIIECTSLKGWWDREIKDVGEVVGPLTEHHQQHPFFPSLTILEISNCPLLITMPLFPNLEELKIIDTSSKPLEQTIVMKLKNDGVATTSSASSSSSSSFPLSKLKDLDIYNASDFESLPTAIENLSSLARLSIIGCSNLASLPEGIGSLSSLTDLTIKRCSNLTSLPEGIGSLSSLTDLTINGCSNLTSLPKGIGSLSSLTDLTIDGCSNLTSLPEGIGSLSSLTDLVIVGCSNLTSLPEGIGSLSSLTDLEIVGCSNLTSLPEGIGSLSSLTDLTIDGCSNLTSLPEGIGSNLTSLPEGIGSLSSLTDLIIDGCSNLTSLPEGIGSLSSLTDLTIDGCSNLTSLPEGIGSLSSLTHLVIGGCGNLTSLPKGIGSLSSLTDLTIDGCSNLTSLPEGIGSLSSLTRLRIVGCSNLTTLPEGIGSLPSLKWVNGQSCTQIPMNALADYLLQQNKE